MATYYWRGGTGNFTNAATGNLAATATAGLFTASRALQILTVTAVASGTITAGDTVWHTNGTSAGVVAAYGTAGTTGVGGTGTYQVSLSGTLSSRTMSSATIGAGPITSSDDFVLDANSTVGTATASITTGVGAIPSMRHFTASGLSAAITILLGSAGMTIAGDVSLPASNLILSGSSGAITLSATTSRTLTSNGVSFPSPVTFNGVSGAWQLQDNFICSGTVTLTNGAIDLNNFTLTAAIFVSSNSNTRSVAFGTTGKIVITANNATVLSMTTMTNFSCTGTSNIELTYAGATGTRTIIAGSTGGTETNAMNIRVTGGTDTLTFGGGVFRDFNSSGHTGPMGHTANTTVYGDMTLDGASSWPTPAVISLTFGKTTGVQTLTTNGVRLDVITAVNGVGGTLKLLDNLLANTTSSRPFNLTNGTLDLNGFTLTASYFRTQTGTKNITWNGGTIVAEGAGSSAFDNVAPTNFTATAGSGAGTISLTSASAKTFIGGGSTWNATLNQGGAGNLTLTGSSSLYDITNTVNSTSILFTAATTTTFTNGFHVNDSTIGSVTAANHNLSLAAGVVSVSNNTISRSQAAGGASWQSYTTNGNTDGGNNSGWIFTAPASTGNFLIFFE